MKVYVTKYALTRGVLLVDVELCSASSGEQQMVKEIGSPSPRYYHGRDWHISWEAAKAQAEELRDKAIASSKKRIVKLESMTFEEPEGVEDD